MSSTIGEFQPRARDEVSDSARYQHLSGYGQRGNASTDMDRDSPDVVVNLFAFAGMEACANFDPDRMHFVDNRARASNGAGGTVECNEKAIAGRVSLAATKAAYVASYHCIVPV